MPTTYFYTVDSEIIGEHTAGQSRIDYLTDALGSIVATVDQNQQLRRPQGTSHSATIWLERELCSATGYL
jgi:hypothetical protein